MLSTLTLSRSRATAIAAALLLAGGLGGWLLHKTQHPGADELMQDEAEQAARALERLQNKPARSAWP